VRDLSLCKSTKKGAPADSVTDSEKRCKGSLDDLFDSMIQLMDEHRHWLKETGGNMHYFKEGDKAERSTNET
jgi:hypothetical protein